MNNDNHRKGQGLGESKEYELRVGVRPPFYPLPRQDSQPSLLTHSPNHKPLPTKPKQKNKHKNTIYFFLAHRLNSVGWCQIITSKTGTGRMKVGFLIASRGNWSETVGERIQSSLAFPNQLGGLRQVPSPSWVPREGWETRASPSPGTQAHCCLH